MRSPTRGVAARDELRQRAPGADEVQEETNPPRRSGEARISRAFGLPRCGQRSGASPAEVGVAVAAVMRRGDERHRSIWPCPDRGPQSASAWMERRHHPS